MQNDMQHEDGHDPQQLQQQEQELWKEPKKRLTTLIRQGYNCYPEKDMKKNKMVMIKEKAIPKPNENAVVFAPGFTDRPSNTRFDAILRRKLEEFKAKYNNNNNNEISTTAATTSTSNSSSSSWRVSSECIPDIQAFLKDYRAGRFFYQVDGLVIPAPSRSCPILVQIVLNKLKYMERHPLQQQQQQEKATCTPPTTTKAKETTTNKTTQNQASMKISPVTPPTTTTTSQIITNEAALAGQEQQQQEQQQQQQQFQISRGADGRFQSPTPSTDTPSPRRKKGGPRRKMPIVHSCTTSSSAASSSSSSSILPPILQDKPSAHVVSPSPSESKVSHKNKNHPPQMDMVTTRRMARASASGSIIGVESTERLPPPPPTTTTTLLALRRKRGRPRKTPIVANPSTTTATKNTTGTMVLPRTRNSVVATTTTTGTTTAAEAAARDVRNNTKAPAISSSSNSKVIDCCLASSDSFSDSDDDDDDDCEDPHWFLGARPPPKRPRRNESQSLRFQINAAFASTPATRTRASVAAAATVPAHQATTFVAASSSTAAVTRPKPPPTQATTAAASPATRCSQTTVFPTSPEVLAARAAYERTAHTRIAEMSAWLADKIGYGALPAEMEEYARILFDLGCHCVSMMEAGEVFTSVAEIESFRDWMKPYHRKRLIKLLVQQQQQQQEAVPPPQVLFEQQQQQASLVQQQQQQPPSGE